MNSSPDVYKKYILEIWGEALPKPLGKVQRPFVGDIAQKLSHLWVCFWQQKLLIKHNNNTETELVYSIRNSDAPLRGISYIERHISEFLPIISILCIINSTISVRVFVLSHTFSKRNAAQLGEIVRKRTTTAHTRITNYGCDYAVTPIVIFANKRATGCHTQATQHNWRYNNH